MSVAAGPPNLPGPFIPEGPAPPPVADHELLRVIGRGSYGEVWLARHLTLGTQRAVKVVRRADFDEERPFRREFEGLRRYEPISRGHPNLVAILHVGGDDAAFFCVMELADACEMQNEDGRRQKEDAEPTAASVSSFCIPPSTLSAYVPLTLRHELKSRGRLTADETITLGRGLAGALAHLHAHGLVHRDVKPSNVIFVDGVARLADIGLVTAAGDSRSFVGTEGYIPPEGPGAPAADGYALGKLLYELSTGRDRHEYPAPAADLATRPDRARLLELNAVIHRACAFTPAERYADGGAMLADLELLGAGQSVRRAQQAGRRWRFLRRGAVWLAAVAALVTSLALARRESRPPAKLAQLRPRSTNELAQNFYDAGRIHHLKYTEVDAHLAVELYQKAIQADPNFLPAQASLATALIWGQVGTNDVRDIMIQGKQLAERALARDDTLIEAHVAMAAFVYFIERDFPKAESHYLKAIQSDPDNYQLHENYGYALTCEGRTNESIKQLETAVLLNPGSEISCRDLSRALLCARRYPEALAAAQQAVNLDANTSALWALAEALKSSGRFEEFLRAYEQSDRALDPSEPGTIAQWSGWKSAYHEGGEAAFWKKRLEDAISSGSWRAMDLAQAYIGAGRCEEALDVLENAGSNYLIFNRDVQLILTCCLKTDPAWDPLRDNPRFKALLKRLKIAE